MFDFPNPLHFKEELHQAIVAEDAKAIRKLIDTYNSLKTVDKSRIYDTDPSFYSLFWRNFMSNFYHKKLHDHYHIDRRTKNKDYSPFFHAITDLSKKDITKIIIILKNNREKGDGKYFPFLKERLFYATARKSIVLKIVAITSIMLAFIFSFITSVYILKSLLPLMLIKFETIAISIMCAAFVPFMVLIGFAIYGLLTAFYAAIILFLKRRARSIRRDPDNMDGISADMSE